MDETFVAVMLNKDIWGIYFSYRKKLHKLQIQIKSWTTPIHK